MSDVSLPTFDLEIAGANTMRIHVAGGERKNAPVVLVLQEAFGVNSHVKTTAQKVADQGYVAIAPELFHRTAPPGWTGPYQFNDEIKKHYMAVTPETLAADFKAIEFWVKSSGLRADMMAAVGFCLGGRASFTANTVLPLKAAACFYGGRIVEDLNLGFAEKQNGPVQFIWGAKDESIPVSDQRKIEDAMLKADKAFSSTVFSTAPHAFTNFERPSYHAKAAAEAWALTFAFFKNHLAM